MDTVQPLQEDGTLFAHVICVLLVAAAIPKLVTVVQPVDLYEHLKTLETASPIRTSVTLTLDAGKMV